MLSSSESTAQHLHVVILIQLLWLALLGACFGAGLFQRAVKMLITVPNEKQGEELKSPIFFKYPEFEIILFVVYNSILQNILNF